MRRMLKGCGLAILIVVVLLVLTCGFLEVTTTPLSTWFYQHNYYFQDVANFLHTHP